MSKAPLSAFIITFNEADRIGRTLAALQPFCAEVVVVDSGSTDGTAEIAHTLGARVVVREWPGYGPQKVYAQEQCRHDWVLNVDADEVVSAELAAEILGLFEAGEPPVDAFVLKIADVVPGAEAPNRFAYTYRRVRLYRKQRGRFSTSTVHDVVELQADARKQTLEGMIHHFSMRSVGEELTKFNAYSDAQVDDMRRRGVSLPAWRLWIEFPVAFLKAYVLRRYLFEGSYGFVRAMNYAFFRHLRLAKHIERTRR